MNLKAKRADLCAEMERLIGQVNRTNGAIALLDDLIAEQAQEAAAEEEAEAADAWPVTMGRIDRNPSPVWPPLTSAPSENPNRQPPASKEMLPVDRYVAPEGDAA